MNKPQDKNRWVCPNDRELMLRAKLDAGWSVKSGLTSFPSGNQISEMEQQLIMDVLRRSEQINQIEKERIKRLQDRLNNIKRNIIKNSKGQTNDCCSLCNESFGLFGAQCHRCKDCDKPVCSKCGVDTVNQRNEPIWLCKICSETREIHKKSGAWFFHRIPHLQTHLGFSSNLSRKNGSSSSSSSRNTNDTLQADNLSTTSRRTSPVVRRKARSPSPRHYRQGLINPESTEFGATLNALKRRESTTSSDDLPAR